MWMPNRPSPGATRTPSVHSIASFYSSNRSKSMTSSSVQRQSRSYESDNFSDTASEDDNTYPHHTLDITVPPMWQSRPQQSGPTASLFSQKRGDHVDYVASVAPVAVKSQYHDQQEFVKRPIDDDATSRSSTLDGDEEDLEFLAKTPKTQHMMIFKPAVTDNEPLSPVPAQYVPGPLESQLAALMSKLIFLEQDNHAISIRPEEYHETLGRLKALEEEKKNWWKRHEAVWALRDEDVENNIKIRGMLASCRRELEATKILRDEDLKNVQLVRSRLAEKTRELERLQAQTGRASPNRGRPGSFFERRDTSDLFTAAKIAALEQRALELEERNSDLVAQLETSRGSSSIDDLNRLTAHQAWKDTVAGLESTIKAKDAELERTRASGASTGGQMDWYRIEALLEEHASYRESVGGKLQALRCEKETLQKDLHRKENECQALELKVQILQRRASVL
ncbi:hypothetical protein EJ02DRAFT_440467 [Clathrospora elynae]|uniref:Uncharacterized protein n=1 Tax=Clathrospora elynae TaxID=706981 RepID=A0A6A5T935_9PLEO|nr:hypothetical protein EJ02DRAFT_440467 [Clathrospora elynae]